MLFIDVALWIALAVTGYLLITGIKNKEFVGNKAKLTLVLFGIIVLIEILDKIM